MSTTSQILVAAFFSLFQETYLFCGSRFCETKCCKTYLSAEEHSEHCIPFSAHEKEVQRVNRVKITFKILLWPLNNSLKKNTTKTSAYKRRILSCQIRKVWLFWWWKALPIIHLKYYSTFSFGAVFEIIVNLKRR